DEVLVDDGHAHVLLAHRHDRLGIGLADQLDLRVPIGPILFERHGLDAGAERTVDAQEAARHQRAARLPHDLLLQKLPLRVTERVRAGHPHSFAETFYYAHRAPGRKKRGLDYPRQSDPTLKRATFVVAAAGLADGALERGAPGGAGSRSEPTVRRERGVSAGSAPGDAAEVRPTWGSPLARYRAAVSGEMAARRAITSASSSCRCCSSSRRSSAAMPRSPSMRASRGPCSCFRWSIRPTKSASSLVSGRAL